MPTRSICGILKVKSDPTIETFYEDGDAIVRAGGRLDPWFWDLSARQDESRGCRLRIEISMLTIRQLRYLDALARHRHFGRAAEECAVSQPALSMQIHELEECLCGGLVERRQGEAVLTGRGLEIAARAARILSATRDLVDFAYQNKVLSGVLRLGIIPTLAPYILPRIVPQLQLKFPGLRLSLLETHTKTLLSELTRGNVDLLLLALPIQKVDVETAELFDDRFLLAVPAGDPLPETARATPQDVQQRNLLLLEEGHCLRDQALDYCSSTMSDSTGFFATSLTTIMQMVANGYGVTLLPEVATDAEVRDERIKLLRFADPQPRRNVGLMWRRSSPCRSDYIAFGQVVQDATSAPRRRLGLVSPERDKVQRESA